MTLTTMSVASADTSNISVPSVTFARSAFSGQERVAVTAGLANKGDAPAKDIPVVLTVDGHEIETKTATIGAHASSSVTFATFTVAEANIRGSVKAGTDPLPADNTFHFVVSPSEPVSVAVLENGDRAGESLYLTKALAIGTTPTFQADVVPVSRVTPATFDKRSGDRVQRHRRTVGSRRGRAEAVRRTRRRHPRRRRRPHVMADGSGRAAARAPGRHG